MENHSNKKTATDELYPSQKASLELLKIVDSICRTHHLTYSLTSSSLIGAIKKYGFLPSNPYLSITMPYPDYINFIEIFNEMYKSSEQYSLMDADNSEQFEVLFTRLLKRSKVTLPENRKHDEKYYSHYLDIYPVFYVGDTLSDHKKVWKTFVYYSKCLQAFKPAPDTFRLINTFWSIINRYYLKKKTPSDFQKLSDFMPKGKKPTKYAFLSIYSHSGKSKGVARPSKTHIRKAKGVARLSETYTKVIDYDFHGVMTFIPANSEKWISDCYKPKELNELLNQPPNKAKLDGPEIMRRVQLVELDMLVEFDRICRKHNIPYSMYGGTLIGAVRHKGFIPWDDDIDVLMIYDDYLKFFSVAEHELDKEKYFLRTQASDHDNNLMFAQIKRNNTLFCRHGRKDFNTHNGIFIDIVPIFNGSKYLLINKFQRRLASHFRTAIWAHMGANSERNLLKRMYYKAIAKPSNKKNYERFIKCSTMIKKDYGKLVYVAYGRRSPFNRAYGLKSSFENLVDYEFEGHKFLGFADCQAYFDYTFFDYLKYPPVYDRFAKHLPGHIELADLCPLD